MISQGYKNNVIKLLLREFESTQTEHPWPGIKWYCPPSSLVKVCENACI